MPLVRPQLLDRYKFPLIAICTIWDCYFCPNSIIAFYYLLLTCPRFCPYLNTCLTGLTVVKSNVHKLSCFPLSSRPMADHRVTQPNKTHQHGYYTSECVFPKLELRWIKSLFLRWVCSLFWYFCVLCCRADNFHKYNWILPFSGKPLWGFTKALAHSLPFCIALFVVLGLSKSPAFFFPSCSVSG